MVSVHFQKRSNNSYYRWIEYGKYCTPGPTKIILVKHGEEKVHYDCYYQILSLFFTTAIKIAEQLFFANHCLGLKVSSFNGSQGKIAAPSTLMKSVR